MNSDTECVDKLKELDYIIDVVLINGSIAADRGHLLIVNIKKSNFKEKDFCTC